jgi:hypothetical protein
LEGSPRPTPLRTNGRPMAAIGGAYETGPSASTARIAPTSTSGRNGLVSRPVTRGCPLTSASASRSPETMKKAPARSRAVDDLQPRQLGHAVVAHDHRDLVRSQVRHRLDGVAERDHREPRSRQQPSEHAAQDGLVIDVYDLDHQPDRGNDTMNRVCFAAASSRRSPPCRSRMLFEMLRPRPVPSPAGLVVTNGSKIFD